MLLFYSLWILMKVLTTALGKFNRGILDQLIGKPTLCMGKKSLTGTNLRHQFQEASGCSAMIRTICPKPSTSHPHCHITFVVFSLIIVSAAVSGHKHWGGSNCPIIVQDGNKALPAGQRLSAENNPPLRMSCRKSVYMTTQKVSSVMRDWAYWLTNGSRF